MNDGRAAFPEMYTLKRREEAESFAHWRTREMLRSGPVHRAIPRKGRKDYLFNDLHNVLCCEARSCGRCDPDPIGPSKGALEICTAARAATPATARECRGKMFTAGHNAGTTRNHGIEETAKGAVELARRTMSGN
jgi:hypothetical protein